MSAPLGGADDATPPDGTPVPPGGFRAQPALPAASAGASPDARGAISEAGRMWAFASYASLFVGLPLFLVPMIQRDNAFALHHARHAAACFLAFVALALGVGVFSLITCGIGAVAFPLALLPYVPAVHGLMLVSEGKWAEPWGLFGVGDRLFASMTLKPPGAP